MKFTTNPPIYHFVQGEQRLLHGASWRAWLQLGTGPDGEGSDRCRQGELELIFSPGKYYNKQSAAHLPASHHVTRDLMLTGQPGSDLVSIPSPCNVDLINIY